MSQILKIRGTQYHGSTWECMCCGKECLNDIATKGLKRVKCDECVAEKKRLAHMIKYWEKKVLKK